MRLWLRWCVVLIYPLSNTFDTRPCLSVCMCVCLQAEDWARSRGMLFLETSAKTREGIHHVFNEVAQQILQNPALLSNIR